MKKINFILVIFLSVVFSLPFGKSKNGLLLAQFTTLWTQTNNPSANFDAAIAITADASGIDVAGIDESLGVSNYQWRIEKRELATGALISTFGTGGVVTSNPSAIWDYVYAITADASGIYVVGVDYAPGNYQWRIEKRYPTNGALISTFGTGGVVTSNPSGSVDDAYAITANAIGIYVAGYDNSQGNYQWRIEKRDQTTGALVAAFGTGGVVTSNPSGGIDLVYAITSDASGIYVAGRDASPGNIEWRIEKRDLTTGTLIPSFGIGGVVTNNPSSSTDEVYSITVDGSGIYVAGYDNSPGNDQWRIEKRDMINGAFITSFGTGGGVTSNPSVGNDQWRIEMRDLTTGALICVPKTDNPSSGTDFPNSITANASGIYVAGRDNNPGNAQWRIEKYSPCITSLSINISSNNVLCYGQCTGTATVNVTNGTSPYTYSWNTVPVQTMQTATGLCAGSYSVTVTDAALAGITSTVNITQPPLLTAIANATPAACNSNSGTAIITAGGGSPSYTYSWNPGGQTDQTATGLAVGNYTATVTDANGCTQTQTVSVTQTFPPAVTANATPTTLTTGGNAQLTATGGGAYSWSPAIGLSCTTCANPTVAPTQTTDYCVVVTDSNGCKDSACVTINIDTPCGTLYIPNAFSPNNDMENDWECVMGNCIESFHFTIYDRWGEKMFETIDQKKCWDGMYNGKLRNTQVFIYYIEATLLSGEKINKKGNISLIQ